MIPNGIVNKFRWIFLCMLSTEPQYDSRKMLRLWHWEYKSAERSFCLQLFTMDFCILWNKFRWNWSSVYLSLEHSHCPDFVMACFFGQDTQPVPNECNSKSRHLWEMKALLVVLLVVSRDRKNGLCCHCSSNLSPQTFTGNIGLS